MFIGTHSMFINRILILKKKYIEKCIIIIIIISDHDAAPPPKKKKNPHVPMVRPTRKNSHRHI